MEANAFAAEFLIPRAALEHWARELRPETVTLEHVVRLAAEYGVSSQMVRYRLATAGLITEPSRRRKLDDEIAAGDHLVLARFLGLSAPRDRLAENAGRLPRIPAPLRAGPLGRFLAGELDAAALAEQLGLDRAAVRRMLVNFGLDGFAPAA